jgi:hypothetical protein
MPSLPLPSSPLLSPLPLPCTVLPCTKASDIPGMYSVQLVPSHRRELQTAMSTVAGLTSALANMAVGHIVLAPGTYNLTAQLSITRSVVLEAAVAGSVVLDALVRSSNVAGCSIIQNAQASSSNLRRVLNINPGSSGVVQLIGIRITGGCTTTCCPGGCQTEIFCSDSLGSVFPLRFPFRGSAEGRMVKGQGALLLLQLSGAVGQFCYDTCNYYIDHECDDDGGLGAEYANCFSTECCNCGPRHPLPAPADSLHPLPAGTGVVGLTFLLSIGIFLATTAGLIEWSMRLVNTQLWWRCKMQDASGIMRGLSQPGGGPWRFWSCVIRVGAVRAICRHRRRGYGGSTGGATVVMTITSTADDRMLTLFLILCSLVTATCQVTDSCACGGPCLSVCRCGNANSGSSCISCCGGGHFHHPHSPTHFHHPHSPTAGLCSNTCTLAFDNDCDDGGPGAEFSGSCSLGTDCWDCGTRSSSHSHHPHSHNPHSHYPQPPAPPPHSHCRTPTAPAPATIT